MDADSHVVTVGASAGGVEALTRFVANLPADLDAPVLVVLHVAPDLPSTLPRILERSGPLPCAHAADGEPLRAGRIEVAPPDRHMAVEDGCIRVWKGSRENRHRPSIDVLFRSAAIAYGPRTIGVILSGALDDGVAGMDAIVRAGGHALVQDPDEARHPYLPLNVLHAVPGSENLPMKMLVERLQELTNGPGGRNPGDHSVETARLEQEIGMRMGSREEMRSLGHLSGIACPECSGALTTIDSDNHLRYRCRTGHAYTAQSLLLEQSEQVDRLLGQTLRQMRESAETGRALLEHARRRHDQVRAAHLEQRLRSTERAIERLHQLMTADPTAPVRPEP